MVLNVDKKYNLIITSKEKERNKVNVIIANDLKHCRAALRVESLTMVDYSPIINGVTIIPHKFDICNNLELSIIFSEEPDFSVSFETNRIKVNMKGGS